MFVLVDGLTRTERRDILDWSADATVRWGLVLSPLVVDSASWHADLPIARSIAAEGAPL